MWHFVIDLDLILMTFILKLNLDMFKAYLYTENKVPILSSLKVTAWRTDLSEYLMVTKHTTQQDSPPAWT